MTTIISNYSLGKYEIEVEELDDKTYVARVFYYSNVLMTTKPQHSATDAEWYAERWIDRREGRE